MGRSLELAMIFFGDWGYLRPYSVKTKKTGFWPGDHCFLNHRIVGRPISRQRQPTEMNQLSILPTSCGVVYGSMQRVRSPCQNNHKIICKLFNEQGKFAWWVPSSVCFQWIGVRKNLYENLRIHQVRHFRRTVSGADCPGVGVGHSKRPHFLGAHPRHINSLKHKNLWQSVRICLKGLIWDG
jgi:hypothetical protein